MYGHKYTEEEKQFFIEFVPGHSYKEIQQEFTRRFGCEITTSRIKSYIGNHKLKTGTTGQFKKGQVSHNKGKKMPPEIYEKCAKTMFKKGNIPSNHRPVGSERLTKDGYVEIKIAEPNKWALKHRYIWEKENGKIPDKHILIFRDNDKTNVNLENLILISQSENLVINRHGLQHAAGEAKETVVGYAKLSDLTAKKKNKGKKDKVQKEQ